MREFFLTKYSVRGIKALDQMVTLSFYKKTISPDLDTQSYNVKGIYGANGSGKSGIVASVDILKNLLVSTNYLNNPIVQQYLESIINKKTGELYIECEFLCGKKNVTFLFCYQVQVTKNLTGKYVIAYEHLAYKDALKNKGWEDIFTIQDGQQPQLPKREPFAELFLPMTTNLLSSVTIDALLFEKVRSGAIKKEDIGGSILFLGLSLLFSFGTKLHVFLNQEDDHKTYIVKQAMEVSHTTLDLDLWMDNFVRLENDYIETISISENIVSKAFYHRFENTVQQLYDFLHIFKDELRGIEIDKKENNGVYICDLVMQYENYNIHAEYESTGIKKLIRLYTFLREMVQGAVVFIDEFDANLHDVYLCALLEYLMEYGEGQLCFTTHNVGPMDILKRNRKSIDFLSEDNQIHQWKTNGNYSPSKLYRKGMIEGSPFNVDSIDFIGVFDDIRGENNGAPVDFCGGDK